MIDKCDYIKNFCMAETIVKSSQRTNPNLKENICDISQKRADIPLLKEED
jgi:hypothetical protein